MLDMAKSSIILFFQGKLFQNPTEVRRQLAIGVAVTFVIFIVAAKLLGLGLPLSGLIAGLIGGAVQPYLFRNLKFR